MLLGSLRIRAKQDRYGKEAWNDTTRSRVCRKQRGENSKG